MTQWKFTTSPSNEGEKISKLFFKKPLTNQSTCAIIITERRKEIKKNGLQRIKEVVQEHRKRLFYDKRIANKT